MHGCDCCVWCVCVRVRERRKIELTVWGKKVPIGCVSVRARVRSRAYMPQLKECASRWLGSDTSDTCKQSAQKMRKYSSTNVPWVLHCHPDRKKSVHVQVWGVHVCVHARARVSVCVCVSWRHLTKNGMRWESSTISSSPVQNRSIKSEELVDVACASNNMLTDFSGPNWCPPVNSPCFTCGQSHADMPYFPKYISMISVASTCW